MRACVRGFGGAKVLPLHEAWVIEAVDYHVLQFLLLLNASSTMST